MVTWQSLGKQAEQLSWCEIAPHGDRQRLALIWQLVRSLLRRSASTENSPILGSANSLTKEEQYQLPIFGLMTN